MSELSISTQGSGLTTKDLRILMALEQNPLATYDELAELTGYAKSVVFGIIKGLEETPNQSPCFRVSAYPNNNNLGLEIVDIIVSANLESQLNFLENLCIEHPYTLYRARCFGDTNGILLQFRIPIGSSNHIITLFNILQTKKAIDSFILLEFHQPPIYTATHVKNWDYKLHKWTFDWKKWFSKNSDNDNLIPKLNSIEIGSAKEWVRKRDIAVLSLLSNNVRKKKIDLIDILKNEGFEFTPQTFSRRLKRIKDECISQYRVFLDQKSFDLLNPILIWGRGKKEEIKKITMRIYHDPIPFYSTFKSEDDLLFWYIHLPTNHVSDLLYLIRPILSEMHFYYMDSPRSEMYLPWAGAYNDEKRDWISDESFMVENVLKSLFPNSTHKKDQ